MIIKSTYYSAKCDICKELYCLISKASGTFVAKNKNLLQENMRIDGWLVRSHSIRCPDCQPKK